jgi:hypothetical protein
MVLIKSPATSGAGDPTVTEVTASGEINTSSGTDVLVTSMTFTPGAGDYMVWFSSAMWIDQSNNDVFVSFYKGGSQVANSETSTNTTRPDHVAKSKKITGVGASDAIEVRWRVSGSTARMQSRNLQWMKVA